MRDYLIFVPIAQCLDTLSTLVDIRPPLQYMRDYPILVDSPWFVVGDFNCVCRITKRQGGGQVPRARHMETFNDFIFRAALIEPPTFGKVWTWCNERQGGARIYERIDRCFTNNIAIVQCPILVTLLPRYRSNHTS
ncbi:unnamed protein product [Spirodela intermedia]|uniref:Uncharacterized protein n=1 Tax=Spirodela intermedia TaxID=51605 RepID=A0A7I8JM44_SPIIN|nr:unnamed protein product [Spirodela intermedia]CAA6671237.1 unnamed protein product [Spirodela intermedia]